jgi:cation transport regulator ChaC
MTAKDVSPGPIWIFGYGSLIWRPDFEFAERRTGFVRDWVRRFWQASTDHRGVPSQPGRVVTLVREPGARCFGTAYRLCEEDQEAVLERLDHRERGGFIRERLPVHLGGASVSASHSISALVYVATESNPNYLGPAPLEAIARQVLASQGPSGPNLEYVLELADALRSMGAEDDHVFALEALLSGHE